MQYTTLRTSVKENSLAEKRSRKYHRPNEPIKKPSDVIIIIQKAYNINKHELKLDS